MLVNVSKMTTTRTDTTLSMQSETYIIYSHVLNKIFGYDGATNYMDAHLIVAGKSIALATEFSTLTN